jgi:hypothetical protein
MPLKNGLKGAIVKPTTVCAARIAITGSMTQIMHATQVKTLSLPRGSLLECSSLQYRKHR